MTLAACASTPAADHDVSPRGSSTVSMIGGFCVGLAGKSLTALEMRLGPPAKTGAGSHRPQLVGGDGEFIRLFPTGDSWALWHETSGALLVATVSKGKIASVEFSATTSNGGGFACP